MKIETKNLIGEAINLWIMIRLIALPFAVIALIILLLTGCIPEVPEVPTGATCTADGFVLRPVINDPLNITTWEFVLDETGEAMTCTFN